MMEEDEAEKQKNKEVETFSVEETNFSFGKLISAQSMGDYQALKQRGRRVLRINLRRDVVGGLEQLMYLIQRT